MARQFDQPGRSPVYAENGMAATSHPQASASAISILKDGGSATDAAISAAAVLGVVEPHMTGIGGDCFAIVYDKDNIHAINGSGHAAKGANADWYREHGFNDIPKLSSHSVTTPAALKAWHELHQKFGKLPWERLFTDAIALAENGFAVAPRVAFDWAPEVDRLSKDKGSREHYLINSRAPKVGERFKLPALANTLRKIAQNGISAFYEGEIADEIAQTIKNKGAFLNQDDLANAKADWVNPVSSNYQDHDILEIGPNGQGIVTLIMMNLMELFDVTSYPHNSAERYHLEIEIGRVAYTVRDAMVADPEHMKISTDELISIEFAKTLALQIKQLHRNDKIILPELPSSDTVYLTIADRDGQIISFINSIYGTFGAQITTPESGILLQNRGACFTLEKGHPNEIGPSKRPMHTIIPAFAMKDNRPEYAFGVMGGDYQPMGQTHVFANMAAYGQNPQEALDHPRLFWGADGVLEYETGISSAIIGGLEARGHKLRPASMAHGGGQIIKIDHETGFYCAGSDPRKDGLAIGY